MGKKKVFELTVDFLFQFNLGNDTNASQLKKDLARWAVKIQLLHTHLNEHLWLLAKHLPHYHLPIDARTLLKTPRKTKLQLMAPGKYYHFGTRECIIESIEQSKCSISEIDSLQMQIGADGTPTASSVRQEMWPILGFLKQIRQNSPFVTGFYCGPSKPHSANECLRRFVDDMIDIINNGGNYRGKIIRIDLMGFLSDAPARSYIDLTRAFNAYF